MAYMEFEPGRKFPPKNADISDDLGLFKDAGYVLKDEDLVIDIDNLDRDQLKGLIKTFNIKTHTVWTDRGVHFYYKRPEWFTKGANKICPLGFEIEYKHKRNTKATLVKRDGKARKVENEGIREELPFIFASKKKYQNLLGIDDGDGRNTSLFTLRTKLANVKGWEKILNYVNDNILAEPLPNDEFENIIRDINITAEKDNEPVIAEWFMNTHKAVKYLGSVFFLHNERYTNDPEVMKRIIFQKIGHQKIRYIDEIISQVDYRCKLIDNDKEFDIKFKNGILRDGDFIPIESEEFTPYRIDIDYIPDKEPNKDVDAYVDHLTGGEPEYKKFLYEILAHTFITNVDFKTMLAKFFIFVGGGGDGKGTLLEVINKILNKENTTALSVQELTDERYNVTLRGKLANLGDDIDNETINDKQMKIIKNISTCDQISVRELYKQSQEVRLTTTLIFTSNHILKTFEKGESYRRRVVWCPMYSKVKEENKSANFLKTITNKDALEYWVSQIIKAYFRLYENGRFTKSEKVDNFNELYHKENSTATAYLEDYQKDDFIGKRLPDIFTDYEIWAEDNGLNVGSRKMLREALSDKFDIGLGVKKINGKSARVFMDNTNTDQQLY